MQTDKSCADKAKSEYVLIGTLLSFSMAMFVGVTICTKDKSLSDLDNLHEPDDIANGIIENLEEGIARFRKVLEKSGNK